MEVKINSAVISLAKGDITEESVDAIVNAANPRLAGGGGVDGAIHRAGGPRIMEECRLIGACPAGSAVITGGGRLKARYVIHAVGPVYKDGAHNEAGLLRSAYLESLRLAEGKGLSSIAFPSISTGAYGYPVEEASEVALGAILEHAKTKGSVLRLIRMVLFSDSHLRIYAQTLQRLTETQARPR
jgi:O-acetyl-ADP-ribose deacetylase (regulator of RNase III)